MMAVSVILLSFITGLGVAMVGLSTVVVSVVVVGLAILTDERSAPKGGGAR